MPSHDNAARVISLEDSKETVWAGIARSYAAFGSPFVPSRDDIDLVEKAVATRGEGIHAVMLGVTPGIALMQWPRDARITAADGSAAVIGALWPGDIPNVRRAVCAQWLAIPVVPGSCDVVVGDGSLNVCRFPGEVRELCRAVHSLLKEDGILVVRCYVRPSEPETVDEVMAAVLSEAGLTVDQFKMRLYLAMQRSARAGVAVREAARILYRYDIDQRMMRERFGWNGAAIEPFLSWPVSDAVYTFPSLEELRAVLGDCFEEVSITYPGYELGYCCPTLVVRPR
jgi:SAM-dependent methyltransferase